MPRRENKKKMPVDRSLETKENVVRILEVMAKEMGENPDSPEWKQFEDELTRFKNGEDADGADLSRFLLSNLKEFTSGRKNFIRSAKGQEIAQRVAQQLAKEPDIIQHPVFVPLLQHFQAVVAQKKDEYHEIAHLKYDEKTLDGWVIVSNDGHDADKAKKPEEIKPEDKAKEQDVPATEDKTPAQPQMTSAAPR